MSKRSSLSTEPRSEGHLGNFAYNWLRTVSNYVDDHLQELRLLSYGAGAAGVLLIFKSLTRRYKSVRSIPHLLVKRHARLRGHVHRVDDSGTLLVQHLPTMRRHISRTATTRDLLAVQLAGVKTLESSVAWLRENALDQHVVFKLLHLEETMVDCQVSLRKGFLRSIDLNEHLVREGLAEVELARSDELLHSTTYSRLLQRLLAAEMRAKKKHKGVWQQPSFSDRIRTIPHDIQVSAVGWSARMMELVKRSITDRFTRTK